MYSSSSCVDASTASARSSGQGGALGEAPPCPRKRHRLKARLHFSRRRRESWVPGRRQKIARSTPGTRPSRSHDSFSLAPHQTPPPPAPQCVSLCRAFAESDRKQGRGASPLPLAYAEEVVSKQQVRALSCSITGLVISRFDSSRLLGPSWFTKSVV